MMETEEQRKNRLAHFYGITQDEIYLSTKIRDWPYAIAAILIIGVVGFAFFGIWKLIESIFST